MDSNTMGTTENYKRFTLGDLKARRFDLFPRHSEDEFVRLRESVLSVGQTTAIVCDEEGEILSGHGIYRVLLEMGREGEARIEVRRGLDEREKIALAFTSNAEWRYLDHAQRKALAEKHLVLDPETSDREVAARCALSHPTVGRIRKELEKQDSIRATASRRGRDGKTQSVSSKRVIGSPGHLHDVERSLHGGGKSFHLRASKPDAASTAGLLGELRDVHGHAAKLVDELAGPSEAANALIRMINRMAAIGEEMAETGGRASAAADTAFRDSLDAMDREIRSLESKARKQATQGNGEVSGPKRSGEGRTEAA